MTVIINGSGTANGISYFSSPTTFGGTLATASRGISNASVPSGSIIQAVSATSSTQVTTSSASWSDVTNMTATITPTSSTSKILVMVSVQYQLFRSALETTGGFQILRGSTVILYDPANALGLEAAPSSNGRVYFDGRWTYMIVDSPSTTSSTTYKLQFYCGSPTNSGSLQVNQPSGTGEGSIILMEIAA